MRIINSRRKNFGVSAQNLSIDVDLPIKISRGTFEVYLSLTFLFLTVHENYFFASGMKRCTNKFSV